MPALDQLVGDALRLAGRVGDDVEDARREAGLGEDLAPEQPADLRRPLGRLQDDGVAERERRGDRARGEDQRGVPRCDRTDDADRAADSHREGARVGRDHLAERRVRERGRLTEETGDEMHLEHPEAEGAARLAGEHRDDLVLARLEHVGGAEEDALAHRRRRLRPLDERLGRRLDRLARIGAAAGGDLRDDLAAPGVAVLERRAAFCLDELTADEEPRVDPGLGLGAHAPSPFTLDPTAAAPEGHRRSVPFVKTLV